jgi:hypothetical protein
MATKQYKITYMFMDDPSSKHIMYKFGTNADDIEKTFYEYCKDRHWATAKILEIEIPEDGM